uniref:Uncharacterized protein n=1 Tax=Lates calcarifer TaxID=8187 RepID=A0A4W6CPZ1_LATCA
MNPSRHPAEAVPLQTGGYDGPPGQPGGPTVVQYTTVNVTTEPPKDHIIWSLCCFVYSNPFCLGLAALIFSIKVSLYVTVLNRLRDSGKISNCDFSEQILILAIIILTILGVFYTLLTSDQLLPDRCHINYAFKLNN